MERERSYMTFKASLVTIAYFFFMPGRRLYHVMFGAGTPVARHFIMMDTPLGMVTTAPVVIETRSLMSVSSNVPLTLLISGGTKINRK